MRLQPVAQRLRKICHADIAQGRVARQGTGQHRTQSLIHRVGQRVGQGDIVVDQKMHCLQTGFAPRSTLPGEHFEQHQAGGKHVHLRQDTAVLHVFWGHVGRRADRRGLHAIFLIVTERHFAHRVVPHRDTEIHHPRHAASVHQDVGGFEVAVNDAIGMRVSHSVQHRQQHFYGQGRFQSTLLAQHLRQRRPSDVLEHQVGHAVLRVMGGFKHGDDRRVAQSADGAGLIEQYIGLLGLAPKHLDGDLSAQLRVKRQVNHALRTLPQTPHDLKPADAGVQLR